MDEYLLGSTVLRDNAVGEEQHTGSHLPGKSHLMGDYNHGHTRGSKLTHQAEHLTYHLRVESEVGSSKSITSGLIAKARTIATRCCWPPLSASG